MQGLLNVLAPEVVLLADGGGVRQAALPKPIAGAGKVARFIIGALGKTAVAFVREPTSIDGNPALLVRVDDRADGAIAVRVDGAHITGLYYVRTPEKLTGIGSEIFLTR